LLASSDTAGGLNTSTATAASAASGFRLRVPSFSLSAGQLLLVRGPVGTGKTMLLVVVVEVQ